MAEEKEVKDSNELLNLLLIIIGILYILIGVFRFMTWAGIVVPAWLGDIAGESEAALTFFGTQGLISVTLGFWSVVAGIGMFREEEWAMGQGLVILSIMIVEGVASIVRWISNPSSFDLAYWPNYIVIAALLIGVLGFFWLLATYRRYD